MTRPVVMIGLDGVAWPLVERWAEVGELPALGRLIDQGVRGRIRNPEGFNDNAVWASFATARRPERHGWLNFRRMRPGGYEFENVGRDCIDGVSFWQRASDAGRTVTVLDVPKSPASRGLNGVELFDWNAHGPDALQPVSDPPDFAEEVVGRLGRPHVSECLDRNLHGEDLAAWLGVRLAATSASGDLVLEQMQARDADLIVVSFSAGHCVGHQCWHVHDPDHADHDPTEAERIGDPLLAAYRALDHEVGRIVDAASDPSTVVVFAGLGMGPNYTAGAMLDAFLRRADERAPASQVSSGDQAARLWRRMVPVSVRTAMPEAFHRVARRREMHGVARRSFLPVDTGSRSGGIRLNLVGRDEKGVIAPDDVDGVVDRLEALLLGLVDAETGDPIVATVERTAATRTGPYAAFLPDLFVHWTVRPGAPRAVTSPTLGRFHLDPTERTGHHHAHGFFVARGPGLPSGAIAADAEIVDLGPTVAEWLDVDLPDIDGHPLTLAAT